MAAIIFVDVVGYSKMPNQEQQEISQEINERCARFLIPEFRHQRLAGAASHSLLVAAMPTGDGIVICLHKSPRAGFDEGHVVLLLAFYLSWWARLRDVVLRIGLHSGDLNVIEDINGNSNFCGHAINQAQRIMDLGENPHDKARETDKDKGHILCSTDFNQSYLSSQKVLSKLAREVDRYISTRGLLAILPADGSSPAHAARDDIRTEFMIEIAPIDTDYIVKHNYRLKVCNIVLSMKVTSEKEAASGASADGDASSKIVIAGLPIEPELRVTHEILDPRVMDQDNQRGQMLANVLFNGCAKIVAIGSINERFGEHLRAAFSNREKYNIERLTDIHVYFCDEHHLEVMNKLQSMEDPHIVINDWEPTRDMIKLRRESRQNLEEFGERFERIKVKLFEYSFLPCAGVIAGYRENEPDPIVIQVNRYVWGQKSLWSSIQVLRGKTQGAANEEYVKFKRYIAFTQANSKEIQLDAVPRVQDDGERDGDGAGRSDGSARRPGKRRAGGIGA